MKKNLGLALAAALFAAPLRAQITRVEPITAAPSVVAPALSAASASPFAAAPSLLVAAPLAAPVLSAPAFAAAPAALPAASLPAAAAIPASAAAPAAAPARALAASAAPIDGPKIADAPDLAGRALFDQAAAPSRPLADLVSENSNRDLKGVFIQQEHEGSLLAPDPRDSSGNIFRYYRPVEMRPALTAEVNAGLRGFSKLVYSVRRAFQIRGRSAPDAAWRAWTLDAKLAYLDKLEAAITAERGPQAAWDAKVSLILERKETAPDFVTKNPHMEPPPDARRGVVGAKYLQPEIVSAKETPASSVGEALGRARQIIGDTGHAGVQFHIFVKAEPKALLAQMDSLDGALQTVNDVLFAKAAAESDLNIVHASLQPWHRGRSERVRELLTRAADKAHVPPADDRDSEKHAFVGFRYWGMEGDKAVVSLELRGTSLPWKRGPRSGAGHGMELPQDKPERDYASARSYLTLLSLYAEALAQGRAPRVPAVSAVVDENAVEAILQARAAEMGVPAAAYDGMGALARRLTGASKTPQGYLFPFAASAPDAPELQAFAAEVIVLAAKVKAAEEAGHGDYMAHYKYLYWSAYAQWAQRFGARQNALFADLVRASAR